MGLTRYPNGLTVNSTTALAYSALAGDGDLDCNRLFTAGAASIGGALTIGGSLTVNSANGIVGSILSIPVTFVSSSAQQTLPATIPWAGNIIGCMITIGSVSAVASQYTVQVGSAGAVSVASITNTLTTAFSTEALATTTTAVTTASGLKVIRAVQGTAGETSLAILLQRT